MNDTYQKIARACIKPQLIEDIQAITGCTKRMIYNLVARGMLVNIGTKARGLYIVNEHAVVEKDREFKPQKAIEQVSSVWHYAQRCQQEARHV